MKKHLFLGLLGAMALASCSSDEPIENGGGNNGANGDGTSHYLAVNIVSTPASRAAGDQQPGDPDGNATYEEGYGSENAVTKVRFYFFDATGAAVNVRGTANGVNYYDWANPADGGQDMPNVEKMLEATVVIHTGAPDNHGLPSKMVAILNPDASIPTTALSLTELRAITADYVATAKNSTNEAGTFVMMNSVYANGTSEIIANEVPASSYQATAELAKNNPINIYVERNVAKVRVKFDLTNIEYKEFTGMNGYKAAYAKDAEGNRIKDANGNDILVRFPKWSVTAETNMGYLSKHINAGWEKNLFGTELWNWDPYFRSYWALNPTKEEFKQAWHSYKDITDNGGKLFTGGDGNENIIYINENAPQSTATAASPGSDLEKYTKVILAAQLIDEQKNPIELGKYAGLTVAGEPALREAMLEQLKQNGMIYKHWTDGEGTKHFSSLTEEDVAFKTASAVIGSSIETEAETGRYYVYIQLATATANNEALTWNFKNDVQDDAAAENLNTVAKVNSYLKKQLGSAQLWKTGYTYYYFPIQHLGDEGKIGHLGVVRNHIYDCVIDGLTGLGTPVYDPSEEIYPEKPKEEDTFIGAKINILSWRVVPNKVTLDW